MFTFEIKFQNNQVMFAIFILITEMLFFAHYNGNPLMN